MMISGPELLFPTNYLLSDRGIKKALDRGRIKVSDYKDTQLQPASFDLRIGDVSIYNRNSMILGVNEMNMISFEDALDYEPSDEFAVNYFDEEGTVIDIPPNSFVEITPHEKIETDLLTRVDLRSSRGRLGLRIEGYDSSSGVFRLMNYNPNVVRIYGRSPFAQMFFHTEENEGGRIVVDEAEASEIGERLGVPSHGPYLLFNLGENAFIYRKVGLIDTKNLKDAKYDRVKMDNYKLNPLENLVAQLEPEINVPKNMAIQLIDIPYVQESNNGFPDPEMFFHEPIRSNAGFIDPGYNGRITVHLRRTKFPGIYNKGMRIALGVISVFDEDVLRPYGSEELESHYQGSQGDVSRS